jgi:hypothetical protein
MVTSTVYEKTTWIFIFIIIAFSFLSCIIESKDDYNQIRKYRGISFKNYGEVQIGIHKFYNSQEPDTESKPSKFIAIWLNENGS